MMDVGSVVDSTSMQWNKGKKRNKRKFKPGSHARKVNDRVKLSSYLYLYLQQTNLYQLTN